MGIGLQKMFPTKLMSSRQNAASIFAKMDFNQQGAIFLSDVQQYVLAQLQQTMRLHSKQRQPLPVD